MGFDKKSLQAPVMIALAYLFAGAMMGIAAAQVLTIALYIVLTLAVCLLLAVAVLAQMRRSQDDFERGMGKEGSGIVTRT